MNFRTLRSYRLLESRLRYWQKLNPGFDKLIRATAASQPDWIVTNLSIQMVSELDNYSLQGYNPSAVEMPGAYFDYASGSLLVDAKIFNAASLPSQAGMILHELLRANQERLKLTNEYIQNAVEYVMEETLEQVRWNQMDTHYHFFLSDDQFPFDPALPHAPPAHGKTTTAEINAALASGILGEKAIALPLEEHEGRFHKEHCQHELDCPENF